MTKQNQTDAFWCKYYLQFNCLKNWLIFGLLDFMQNKIETTFCFFAKISFYFAEK